MEKQDEKRIQRLENQVLALAHHLSDAYDIIHRFLTTGEVVPASIKKLSAGQQSLRSIQPRRPPVDFLR